MKNSKIPIVIVVSSLAMIGLISIQSYWIINDFDLEKDKIEHSAGEALATAIGLIERHETLAKLKTHQEAKYLFLQDNDTTEPVFPPDDSLIQYAISKNVERIDDRIELQIVEETNGQKHEKKITHGVDNLPFNSSLEDEINLRIQSADSMEIDVSQSPDPLASDLVALRERVKNKKAFLADVVKSLIEVNLNEPIDERIDPDVVDSLLRICLHNHGLNLPFELAVFDGHGQMVFGNPDFEEKMRATVLTAKLFPNDVIQLPYYLHIYFPNIDSYIFKNIWVLLIVSLVLILAVIFTFISITRTVIEQKKNSEIKNDFINNMTHELKTPISTISLACEALNDPHLSHIENVKNRYLQIINAENKRLGLLVEEVLQSAVLDKGDFKLKKEVISLETLLQDVVDKFSIQVKEKGGQIVLSVVPGVKVEADKNHISNVIYNLLDNAVKYSKTDPLIELDLKTREDWATIAVTDHGIGISNDNLKRVFEKLYRVPTGNLHNVKGFGLGLSYVKLITERHGGKVSVESQLGLGSIFKIELPLYKEEHGRNSKAA